MTSAIPAAQGRVIVPKDLHPFAYKYGMLDAKDGRPKRTAWHGEGNYYVNSYLCGYHDQQAGHVQRKAPR